MDLSRLLIEIMGCSIIRDSQFTNLFRLDSLGRSKDWFFGSFQRKSSASMWSMLGIGNIYGWQIISHWWLVLNHRVSADRCRWWIPTTSLKN